MKRLFLTLLVFIPFALTGQQNRELKDGFQQFKYPNGNISSEGFIRNGKPDGYWKSYYVTGVLKSEGKRTSFLLDSIWIFYDQAGDTTEKISYLLGKRNGYYLRYKKDPVHGLYVHTSELYAGDKKEGVARIFYPDGKTRQTIPYINGRKDGLSREYDREGKIITLLEYNNDFLISRERINQTDAAGLKQGEWLEFYPGGAIKTERNYRNDLLHGYYKEYDERGRLLVTLLYDNGKVTGTEIDNSAEIDIENRYDEAGKLIYSGPFKEGVPVGIHREYNSDGTVRIASIYNDNGVLISEGIVDDEGNRNGPWKDFSADGTLIAEGAYVNSRRTGTWKFYNASGKLEQAGSYSNGRIDGTWRWYYPEGELLREEDYYQGRRDGQYTEFTRTGEVIARGEYADGERNGEWIFITGDNREEGNYLLGLRDGEWKAYYPNEKLRFRGEYRQGNPVGHHMLWYDSGRIREDRYYRNGLRTRTWKKYSEEGEVVLSVTYRDDVETSINGVAVNLPESSVRRIK
ncbi:MAG: toxin-antitoxin system YwqK family antitoxin [Bacteroidales bacterium]|jgi:antitoxin component YwqK of YwqJK toxin-antitoxin module|nr:toxin-antitoxin system YwqK family antitoxin [Bacteroidales bacterium]